MHPKGVLRGGLPNLFHASLLLIGIYRLASGRTVMQRTLKMIAIFLAFTGIVGFPALADRTSLTPARNLFSPQQDIEMGRMLSNELEAALQLINNRNANTYVDALGKQLSAHAPGYSFAYHFDILDGNPPHVWALPAGLLFVVRRAVGAALADPQLGAALRR